MWYGAFEVAELTVMGGLKSSMSFLSDCEFAGLLALRSLSHSVSVKVMNSLACTVFLKLNGFPNIIIFYAVQVVSSSIAYFL